VWAQPAAGGGCKPPATGDLPPSGLGVLCCRIFSLSSNKTSRSFTTCTPHLVWRSSIGRPLRAAGHLPRLWPWLRPGPWPARAISWRSREHTAAVATRGGAAERPPGRRGVPPRRAPLTCTQPTVSGPAAASRASLRPPPGAGDGNARTQISFVNHESTSPPHMLTMCTPRLRSVTQAHFVHISPGLGCGSGCLLRGCFDGPRSSTERLAGVLGARMAAPVSVSSELRLHGRSCSAFTTISTADARPLGGWLTGVCLLVGWASTSHAVEAP
jgi:hypothetical protein